jgi:Na+/melibiose symporter-like transporter
MIDFRVFRVRAFSGAVLSSAGMNFSFWPLIIYLPIYLESGLGHSAAVASTLLLAYTLPTLALPPIAERLAVRYQAGVMIPLGLALIGAGLLTVMAGTRTSHAGSAYAVVGMILAGVGLGLTNTPTTNTTTSSVPRDRSGMASGIDMTARMTSLAINISVMGLLLTQGISHYLDRHLTGRLASGDSRTLTSDVVHGDVSRGLKEVALGQDQAGVVHSALRYGIGWVTLYGGVAALLLAAASRATFALTRRRSAAVRTTPAAAGALAPLVALEAECERR